MSVDFHEVKKSFPIEKVAELLGLEVKKQPNGQLRGCCPIHGGNDPRGFVITPGKDLWYCFKGSCGGGDQLALIAALRKCSPKDAAEWLAGGTDSRTVPDREQLPAGSGFPELTYLEPSHEAVEAVGFTQEVAEALGIGYAPKGILRGQVAVPIRRNDGEIAGYIGIIEATLPSKWHLTDPKIVPLKQRRRS